MPKKISYKFIIMLLVLFKIFLSDIVHLEALENKPPEDAVTFAKDEFPTLVEGIVFKNIPSDYGFKDNIGTIRFSDLTPIYSLSADFAFGKSDQMISDNKPTWVAVIFQDDQPVNAIGTNLADDGQYKLAAMGYAPELPKALLNLTDDQVVFHDFSADEYYLYSDTENSVILVDPSGQTNSINQALSVSEFQNMLMERFENVSELEEDSSPGYFNSYFDELSISSNRYIVPLILIVVIIGSYFLFRKRSKLEE